MCRKLAASGTAGGRDAEAEKDPLAGTWEKLYLENDDALVERRDVWVCNTQSRRSP